MRIAMCGVLLAGFGCAQAGTPAATTTRETPDAAVSAPGPDWVLTFADEGDGPAGTAPDPSKWVHDLGGGGWGNGEFQTYTPGNANASYDGKGRLVIEARRESHVGADGIERDYTSARIKSQGLFSQRYGRMAARIKIPTGQGVWPAFWMLSDTFATVGWPACGELDIMENVGHHPGTVHGTLHGPGYSGGAGLQGSTTLPDGQRYTDGFHVYEVQWEPRAIRWYVDGELYSTRTPEDAGPNPWAFDTPQFLILNVAIGGAWPGPPDETTVLPQQLVVDYVRVYRDDNLVVDDDAQARYHAQRIENFAAVEAARMAEALRPAAVPGDVIAAHFRGGGEGVGYHDADAQNQGGAFRTGEGVDLGLCSEPDVDFSVGWTAPGEWLSYDVDVAEAGTYRVEARVANKGPAGTIRLEVGGQAAAVSAQIPDTGDWQTWTTVPMGNVRLEAGAQVVKLVLAEASDAGFVGNVAKLTFSRDKHKAP